MRERVSVSAAVAARPTAVDGAPLKLRVHGEGSNRVGVHAPSQLCPTHSLHALRQDLQQRRLACNEEKEWRAEPRVETAGGVRREGSCGALQGGSDMPCGSPLVS